MSSSVGNWFYRNGSQRVGPVTQEQLCELFRNGTLSVETEVWSDAFRRWTIASKIAALRSLVPGVAGGQSIPAFAARPNSGPPVMGYEAQALTEGPVGIAGWLIIPALALIFAPVREGLITLGLWALAARAAAAGEEGAAGSLRMLASLEGLFALFVVVTAVMFFSKKRAAPAMVIGVHLASIMLTLIMLVMTPTSVVLEATGGTPSNDTAMLTIAKSIVAPLVWIPYFLVSKRVKNTFVN